MLLRNRRNKSLQGIVAIDGPGGAGKSTFAEAISDGINVLGGQAVIVHMDDYYIGDSPRERMIPDGGRYDLERLERELLVPYRRGEVAAYRPYLWDEDIIGPAVPIRPRQILILEGCYSLHTRIMDYIDYGIYLDIPPEVCLQRLRERGQDREEDLHVWQSEELDYRDQSRPYDRAQLIFSPR
jgi:uridine kinase